MKRAFLVPPLAVLLGGCAGFQTALSDAGSESSNFIILFVIFVVVCTIMYALVLAGMFGALWRRRRRTAEEPLTVDSGKHHQSTPLVKTALVVWAGLIAVGLAVLTIASFVTDRSNAAATREPKLLINVTAHQWWWNVEYMSSDPSKIIRTANELHLPVGVPVEITLESSDVIHSFWIPNLAGKQDLVPGRVGDVQLLPRKLGLYRGQCAEFCGIQHAHMALDVTVESQQNFARWLAAQRRPAFAPQTLRELAGYRYVTTRECSSCHNINGTPASARVAPDLTHVASRRSIAAGTLPMSTGNLYGWVADPQSQKPGNHMPTIGLSSDELHSVVAYLQRLK